MAKSIVKLDMTKLKAAVAKRNVTLAEVGEALGHEKSYLSSMYKKCGYLPISTAILMEKLYDMERSEYEYTPPKPKEDKAEKPKKPFTMDDLYKTVYSAVYNATKQAWVDIDKGGE